MKHNKLRRETAAVLPTSCPALWGFGMVSLDRKSKNLRYLPGLRPWLLMTNSLGLCRTILSRTRMKSADLT